MQKVWCFDLDGTITIDNECKRFTIEDDINYYENVKPNNDVISFINKLHSSGERIIIHTARGMKTCGNNVDLVKSRLGNVTIDWLRKNKVSYDEIYFGKPYASFYIDDKGINLKDFLKELL
jgi:capsule biosynthesis phosphatase